VIVYADSSSILSVHLREPLRHDASNIALGASDVMAASLITFVEVRAGLARARFKENPPRLNDESYERALTDFLSDWPKYYSTSVSQELIEKASILAERHRLRGYDAIHLASALALQQLTTEDVTIATWDLELATAAQAEGLSLAHEVTT
jgi:uncharacterized protein